MAAGVLGEKDVNAPIAEPQQQQQQADKNIKSMEYHRQVFQSKMTEKPSKAFISPSDNIMSPCTAKINALRHKHVNKAKPRSLFAAASAKKLTTTTDGSSGRSDSTSGRSTSSPF